MGNRKIRAVITEAKINELANRISLLFWTLTANEKIFLETPSLSAYEKASARIFRDVSALLNDWYAKRQLLLMSSYQIPLQGIYAEVTKGKITTEQETERIKLLFPALKPEEIRALVLTSEQVRRGLPDGKSGPKWMAAYVISKLFPGMRGASYRNIDRLSGELEKRKPALKADINDQILCMEEAIIGKKNIWGRALRDQNKTRPS